MDVMQIPRCKCRKYIGERYSGIICDKCYHIVGAEPIPVMCDWCGGIAHHTRICGCGKYMCRDCYHEHSRCSECDREIHEYWATHKRISGKPGETEYTIHITDNGRLFLEEQVSVVPTQGESSDTR